MCMCVFIYTYLLIYWHNLLLTSYLYFQRKDHAKAESDFHSAIKYNEESVRELTLMNKELTMDIEDHEDKIKEWSVYCVN